MIRLAFAAAAVVALVALLAAACQFGDGGGGRNGSPDVVDLTRSAEVSGVTVEATWLTPESVDGVDADMAPYPLSDFVLLEVQFTTHSGDLGEIDMEGASVLRQGEADVSPTAWISLSDDSHHRAGILAFPREGKDGPAELTLELPEQQVVLLWETAPST